MNRDDNKCEGWYHCWYIVDNIQKNMAANIIFVSLFPQIPLLNVHVYSVMSEEFRFIIWVPIVSGCQCVITGFTVCKCVSLFLYLDTTGTREVKCMTEGTKTV